MTEIIMISVHVELLIIL